MNRLVIRQIRREVSSIVIRYILEVDNVGNE